MSCCRRHAAANAGAMRVPTGRYATALDGCRRPRVAVPPLMLAPRVLTRRSTVAVLCVCMCWPLLLCASDLSMFVIVLMLITAATGHRAVGSVSVPVIVPWRPGSGCVPLPHRAPAAHH